MEQFNRIDQSCKTNALNSQLSCSEDAKSISAPATGFNTGQVAGGQQSPVLYMQPAQESQKRLISLQRASVYDEAEMEVCDIITKN